MDSQTIIYIVIIAALFLIVLKNNQNNKRKLYDRKGRDFRTNFKEKRKAAEKEEKD